MTDSTSVLLAMALLSVAFVFLLSVFWTIHLDFPTIYNPRNSELLGRDDSLWGFLKKLYSRTEQEWIRSVDVDGYLLLLFIRLILRTFLVIGLYGLLVLIPINYAGEQDLTGFDRISMSNIDQGSDLMWAHLLSAYIYTYIVFYFAIQYTQKAQIVRFMYLKQQNIENYSAIVQGIPVMSRSQQSVDFFFKPIYGDQILSITLAENASVLSHFIQERVGFIEKLEESISKSIRKGRPATVPLDSCNFCSPRVDAVKQYKFQIREATHYIEVMRSENLEPVESGTAFLLFSNAVSSLSAAQSLHHFDPSSWVVSRAPKPDDIYWENLNIDITKLDSLRLLGSAITGGIVFLYAIPLAFIAAITNSESLSEDVGFLEPLVQYELIQALIEGIVPATILVLLDHVTPLVLSWVSKTQGLFTFSDIEASVLRKYYLVQIINVFFVVTFAGTIFNSISEINDNPSDALEILGESLPDVAQFFMIYILIQTFISLPVSLLRAVPMINYYYTMTNIKKTERQKEKANRPGMNNFGKIYPQLLLVLLISVTYSTIAPIVIPFAFSFFVMSYFVRGYQLSCVVVNRVDTGGKYWPIATRRLLFATLVYQGTLMAYFSIKLAVEQLPFLVVLIIISSLMSGYIEKYYFSNWEYLPLNEASQLPDIQSYDPHIYKHPALSEAKEHLVCDDYEYAKVLITDLHNIMDPSELETNYPKPAGSKPKTPRAGDPRPYASVQ